MLQARKKGEGSYVDYAVTEGAMSLRGRNMLDFQVKRPDHTPPGFSAGQFAPCGPTWRPTTPIDARARIVSGQDWWVFVALETQRSSNRSAG